MSVCDNLQIPLVESPFFEDICNSLWSGEVLRVARDLNKNGFAVIDFPEPDFEEIAENIKSKFQGEYDWSGWKEGKLKSLRIVDGFSRDENTKRIVVNAKIVALLSELYGREAFPFQSLTFSVGTQQAVHSDHIHFNSIPGRFMCGVWVALEDTDQDNGPLIYYPGSHKWPSFHNEDLGISLDGLKHIYEKSYKLSELWKAMSKQFEIEPETFHARKGQALIWSSNLVHGGSKLNDLSRTRWSQVTHYYFKNCAYYTPLMTDAFCGQITYRKIKNVITGEIVPNIVSGKLINNEEAEKLKPMVTRL